MTVDPHPLTEALAHVVVTNVTPFRPDRTIDYECVARHAQFMVEHGIRVVVPAGNTGEFSSLVPAEIMEVTRTVADAVADRATVVAGVGGATDAAIEMAQYAQSVGAQAIMVHHPTHTYIDRQGIARYYERIIDAVDIGVVLYKRGPALPDPVIAGLAEHERVVAVKYAHPDPNAFERLVRASTADVTWLCGLAERWAPFFHLAGADGFTSGLANFAPHVALDLHAALERGDYAAAMRLRAAVVEFEDLRQIDDSAYNVPAVKEGMRAMGLSDEIVREPLRVLDDEHRQVVARAIAGWGLDAPAAA
jgi:4-hydroxy-tetrahydrodipicolinate synthase